MVAGVESVEKKGKRTLTVPASQRIYLEDRFQKTSSLFFGVLGGFGVLLVILAILARGFCGI